MSKVSDKTNTALRQIRLQIILAMLNEDPVLREILKLYL